MKNIIHEEIDRLNSEILRSNEKIDSLMDNYLTNKDEIIRLSTWLIILLGQIHALIDLTKEAKRL